MKIYNKNIKINSFTHWNVASFCICIFYKNINFYYINLYNITTCLSFTIFITFNSSILYDKYAFEKIRNKINCNYLEFHSGNFILHTLPCIYLYNNLPTYIYFHDSIISLILLVLWCFISTNGTMDLSNIYVKFSKNTVIKLYSTSILSCLSFPLIHKIFIKYL